ncbi:isoleucine--tRNA ligase [uncultured Eubacterium sp.]|uniref:isoleucine--tRNA ligase n=1 Tax=uncultured Eubacterium sp. TaxID=165185 RepID=UPI0025D00101|nr:isoleucine--tRNA ligase [uncultured Eubacterium sp.]
MDYNKTLNLPKTDFPMRASLPQREPEFLKKWNENDQYKKLMDYNEGKPLFVLHDGPPYANGDIHIGHALNKTLKDFIVRYKNMTGFKSPFVPGWDTHGLPTELAARKKAGITAESNISDLELRKICRDTALGYVNLQRESFKRMGIIAEWDNPYITLKKEFEQEQIKVFANMASKGYIYKGLKPVYWCSDCNTALAEAEIEYAEDPCHSIYVKFKVTEDFGKLTALGAELDKTYFVIWTTTTWTLPANVAICVGPNYEYSLLKANGEYYVMATDLAPVAMADAGITDYETVGIIRGDELEYMKTAHPFIDRTSLVIVGDHVTLESGTGCVHTAPGHGVDDFIVCKKYPEIPIVVPVDNKGVLTEEAGQFAGLTTEEANKPIAEYLDKIGALFALKKIKHQYPHCWRCHKPVIFRATSQWFCSVDDFKDAAVKAAEDVKWYPEWGKDRLQSMVLERADWCISRQRKWGVPIPVVYCKDCGKEIIDDGVMQKVSDIFGKEGSDAWYAHDAEYFLPEGFKCPHCGKSNGFEKESDIMDVWFDSGSSHAAVCRKRPYLKWPADVYLEGADQYRGWFQSSLLTSVAAGDGAPYKQIITHGWTVDGEGRKMSKSLGNGIAPQEIISKYGADILRLWVASADYHADIRISPEILKQISDNYRKLRNTARYCLGNLYDFDPDNDMVSNDELEELDKYALMKLDEVIAIARKGYDEYEYHTTAHALHNFCVVDMSNFYFDVLKDRLYTTAPDSKSRRAAQTVLYKVLDALTLILTPILAFTCDEIWTAMKHDKSRNPEGPLFNSIPTADYIETDEAFIAKWDRIHEIRTDVQKALELARNEKVIGKPLEAKVTLYADGELADFLKSELKSLPEIFITSAVEIADGEGEFKGDVKGLSITVNKADGEKCERCWKFSDTVGQDSEHPTLCAHCAETMKQL